MRHLATIGIAACLTVVAAVATAQPAERAGTTPRIAVKVGIALRPDAAPLVLALRRGYFERQGLDVELVGGTSGQEFVPALALNQIQVMSGSPNAALFNALNRGVDIRMVADFAHMGDSEDGAVSIMARADLVDSGILKTPADLKGRTVIAGPSRGDYPDVLFQKIFDLGKLSSADVTVRHVDFAGALAALNTKTADAAFMIEPMILQAERQNIARILMRGGAVNPGAELSIIDFSPSFAKDEDAAVKFMVGYLEGARDYHDAFALKQDREGAIALLMQYLPPKDPAIWREALRHYPDLNGQINVADLKSQAAFYKAQGTLSGPVPDIDKYVDPQFAEAAVKRIGRR
jgi:NitT/TauT family transport system substrate-binding protein